MSDLQSREQMLNGLRSSNATEGSSMAHLTRTHRGQAQAPGRLNPTTKASQYRHFEKWYQPVVVDGTDSVMREFTDPLWEKLREGDGFRHVWTITDCAGSLYLLPGFHFINRMAWVYCTVPWQDDENRRGGYTW